MLKDMQEIDKRWLKTKQNKKLNSLQTKSQIIYTHWHWVAFAVSADTPTDKQVMLHFKNEKTKNKSNCFSALFCCGTSDSAGSTILIPSILHACLYRWVLPMDALNSENVNQHSFQFDQFPWKGFSRLFLRLGRK